jgi:hypothetical protein
LHWDLRLEFPVDSVSKALADYSGKRPKKGVEPTAETPDKPGNVLRSWAIPKHRFPSDRPLLATETENHIMSYANFKGTIPSGYGAGTVEIVDKGTYTLDKVEFDHKYVFTFHGKKEKGTYALIKTHGKSFLWIKTKKNKDHSSKKIASAIDYIQPSLPPRLFDLNSPGLPLLRDNIRDATIATLTDAFEEKGFKRPFQWITGLYLSGSSAAFNYQDDSDFDVDILYDSELIREYHPETAQLDEKPLTKYLQAIINKENNKPVAGTSHTFSYMVLESGDFPSGDGIYDILHNAWFKEPLKIPEDFDPDKTFAPQKAVAEKVQQTIDLIIGKIIRIVDTLKVMDNFIKTHKDCEPWLEPRRIIHLKRLQDYCKALNVWYNWIWGLQKEAKETKNPIYPAFNYSANWDERMIIFKYIARSGYQQCVSMLYKQLKSDPYLKIIDKFIPD